MPITSTIRASVLAARERLAEGAEKFRAEHDAGCPGIQLCARQSDLMDEVVLGVFESVLADLGEDGPDGLLHDVAVLPLGGYGRRELAPHSDVDLMILHSPQVTARVEPLAKRLLQDLFDVGCDLAQSVRTPAQACQLARSDATIYTSLAESRYLAGGVSLHEKFATKFLSSSRRYRRAAQAMIEAARRDERHQYGETVYLLTPNVKRSEGGLRDIQLLGWIGFAAYGTADFDSLGRMDVLDKDDQRKIRRAKEFLLRLRNELHFHAGKAQDGLDRTEQLRLAERYAYEGAEGMLPVEQFMSEYFQRTGEVHSVVSRFVKGARPGVRLARFFAPLLSRQVEGDYRVGPYQISTTAKGLKKLQGDLGEILRLADMANLLDKRIEHSTWEAVRQSARELADEITPDQAQRFLSLLSQPGQLGRLLRRLHDLGVLEKIIPEFTHARALLQFNEYHKYTVDEHCLRAVEAATDLLGDDGPAGRVYRAIKDKRTLHLALLIHDLGKGHPEDHSELGLEIAERTAERLRLPLREAETLKFLVHRHLTMAHLAFRRDTTDEQLILNFAVDVGSPEVLRMLFVLTVCDFAAVGPGVLNDWKVEVLAELYGRAMKHLAGDTPAMTSEERKQRRCDKVRQCLGEQADEEWFERQIEALPPAYLFGTPPERIGAELRQLHRLADGEVEAWGRFLPDRSAVEYTVGTREHVAPGIFHRLTGALSSHGLQILSAEINTLADDLVLDRFFVIDPDYKQRPSDDRIESITAALVRSLGSSGDQQPTFRRTWRNSAERDRENIVTQPSRVRVDNNTSDRFTIVDVFAHDRMGLLFTITRTLFELGVSVHLAKIGTYLDQVVDVFYVTEMAGGKIEDEERLEELRRRVLAAVEELGV
jgi:[protein-PII] uridylyltransferase